MEMYYYKEFLDQELILLIWLLLLLLFFFFFSFCGELFRKPKAMSFQIITGELKMNIYLLFVYNCSCFTRVTFLI